MIRSFSFLDRDHSLYSFASNSQRIWLIKVFDLLGTRLRDIWYGSAQKCNATFNKFQMLNVSHIVFILNGKCLFSSTNRNTVVLSYCYDIAYPYSFCFSVCFIIFFSQVSIAMGVFELLCCDRLKNKNPSDMLLW